MAVTKPKKLDLDEDLELNPDLDKDLDEDLDEEDRPKKISAKKAPPKKSFLKFLPLICVIIVLVIGFFLKFKPTSFVNKAVALIPTGDKQLLINTSNLIQEFKLEFEHYPSSMNEILDMEYLDVEPRDSYHNPISYRYFEGGSYELRSLGADGHMGTKDDLCLGINNSRKDNVEFFGCQSL